MGSPDAEERLTELEKTARNRRFGETPPALLEKARVPVTVRKLIRHLLAEFLALIIFCYVGGMALLSGQLVAIALAHGLTIALLVIAIGHISGAHLNPAVTVGLLINQKISVLEGILYIVVQLAGSLVGGALIYGSLNSANYYRINGGALTIPFPSDPVIGKLSQGTDFGVFLVEVVLTANLVYVVLMSAADRSDNALAALGIGFAVVVGIFAGGSVSGASMNPARTFGPLSIYSATYKYQFDSNWKWDDLSNYCPGSVDKGTVCVRYDLLWKYSWVQLIGPLVGGAIAGVVYRIFYAFRNNEEDH